MKKPLVYKIVALLLVTTLALAGCAQSNGPAGGDVSARTIRVVATTGMVADLVRHVGGARVEVTQLMGPGVDPHLYKAKASDAQAMEDADIIFYNGLHLEGKMVELFEKMQSKKPTVAVAEVMPVERLRKPIQFEGNYDPHVWFDVSLWTFTVAAVEQGLSQLDPGSAALYTANASAYRNDLGTLHSYALEQLATIPPERRVLITAHDAFGYFGLVYGLEVRGLQGTSTASEAGAADVQALAQFIADRGIKAIFVESSVPARTIEAVQAAVEAKGKAVAIGGQLYSDALGELGTPEGEYVGMVRYNVDTIVAALK